MNKIINNLSSGESSLLNSSFNQSSSTLSKSPENENLEAKSQADGIYFNNLIPTSTKSKKSNSFYSSSSQIGSRLNIIA